MDPMSLILSFMMQQPQLAAQAVEQTTAPGQIQREQLMSSMIDFGRQALKCYHPSARFTDANILGQGWKQQWKYGAQKSLVMQIDFQGGLTLTPYQMVVAVMGRPDQMRTAVISDTALIVYNSKCQLEEWVSVAR